MISLFALYCLTYFALVQGFHSSIRTHLKSRKNTVLFEDKLTNTDNTESPARPSFFTSIKSKIFSSLPFGKEENKETTKSDLEAKVVIIGAGISGLACAKTLLNNGFSDFLLVESSESAGGRIQTEQVDGFLLDKGFQVFIDSYPEAKEIFDYKKLQLQKFLPGALVHFEDNLYLVSDPLRRLGDLLPTITSPIGTLADKLKVGVYSILIRFVKLDKLLAKSEKNTSDFLRSEVGVSKEMIERFFNPFYQGIFLSPLTKQSSRMFEFVFKMFTEGSATLPLFGMQQIPDQLLSAIPTESTLFLTRVTSIKPAINGGYILSTETKNDMMSTKKTIKCEQLILATDPPEAQKLLNNVKVPSYSNAETLEKKDISIEIPEARGSTCLYYSIDGPPPVTMPILILNGENAMKEERYRPTINNVCFPSQISPAYAPQGKSLASVTVVGTQLQQPSVALLSGGRGSEQFFGLGNVGSRVLLGDDELKRVVKRQLVQWWGPEVEKWELLKIYRIPYAQPAQTPPYEINGKDLEIADGLFCIGDHRATATLNGAVASGRKAANMALEKIKNTLVVKNPLQSEIEVSVVEAEISKEE